ncbi:MAG: hypothetical protein HC852_10710 [Acaryochloridaceae cyanobacterium RU_4_10]|nr:hypothetical protein [Acaryochloridaceae cyanobacterium RU_4_10]
MMRLRSVAIVSSISALLLASLPSLRLDLYPKKAIAVSQQTQETTINLSAKDLKQPQTLSIRSSQSLTQMTGEIKVNGKSIKKLSRNFTQINLAPILKSGKISLFYQVDIVQPILLSMLNLLRLTIMSANRSQEVALSSKS